MIVTESRAVVAWGTTQGRGWRKGFTKGHRKLLGMMDTFIVLIRVIKLFKHMEFIICQLYPTNLLKKNTYVSVTHAYHFPT